MRFQSTVIGQLLKAVPRGRFERLASAHQSGRTKRALSAWGHVAAMVVAQFCGARSLRDLERLLERQSGALAHLGLKDVRRSTLSDANATRPAALFEALAAELAAQLGGGRGRGALRLIDATRLFGGRCIEQWTASGGVKLHLVYDPDTPRPTCFVVTPERVNDITAAKAMPIEPGATYVFDKGYYDFAFWARLDAAGCRFVTRLKRNSPVRSVETRPVEAGGAILEDRVVTLSERLAGQRRNPFAAALRLVRLRIDNGRELTLLSNDLAADAAEIGALYKARWQIELFFKWLKQNLKITRFLGTSRNAVIIQIVAALITFILLRIAHRATHAVMPLQAAHRLIAHAAFTRRPLRELFQPVSRTIGQRYAPQLLLAIP
ncbi:MAG TPA: IS4 family transposase [Polyangia bacterium]|jgi:hypothetical protein|nr:IS4 family transposase [Polyangia bacterium]